MQQQQQWRRRQPSGAVEPRDSDASMSSLPMIVQRESPRLVSHVTHVGVPLPLRSCTRNGDQPTDVSVAGTVRDPTLYISDSTVSLENSISCAEENFWSATDGLFVDTQTASSLFQTYCGEVQEGKDAKAMQASLLKAFPESLRHIATDETAVDTVLSNNAAGVVDSGYHRHFTELVLREVYALLVRTANAFEKRRGYLQSHTTAEMGRTNPKALDNFVMEESSRSLSEWSGAWYQRSSPDRLNTLVAVTVRPPKFVAGMLWNGWDRFLLGGTAFMEEGRILQVRVQSGCKTSDVGVGAKTFNNTGLGEARTHARMLLREFVSISKAGVGCMVQTFSLIPDHVSVVTSRSQSMKYSLIQGMLDQCLPGAVSRAFSLGVLLPPPVRTSLVGNNVSDPVKSYISCAPFPNRQSLGDVGGVSLCGNISSSWLGAQSVSVTMLKARPVATRNTWRQPLGDEAYLRFTNPRLYAWVMQHSPAVLTAHTDAIREYLLWSQRLRLCRQMKRLLHAVCIIQRFLRLCIRRKKRAVQRMMRQWRELELSSLDHLRRSTLQPTTTDRISFIVSTVIWQHILTTEEFKLAMLEELFTARRIEYRNWCAQRLEEEGEVVTHEDARETTFLTDGGRETNPAPAATACRKRSHHKWISKWRDVLHRRFGWNIDPEYLLQESHRRMLISLRNSILSTAVVQEEVKKRCGTNVFPLY